MLDWNQNDQALEALCKGWQKNQIVDKSENKKKKNIIRNYRLLVQLFDEITETPSASIQNKLALSLIPTITNEGTLRKIFRRIRWLLYNYDTNEDKSEEGEGKGEDE